MDTLFQAIVSFFASVGLLFGFHQTVPVASTAQTLQQGEIAQQKQSIQQAPTSQLSTVVEKINDTSSTSLISVVSLMKNGTYFDYNASSTTSLNLNSLEKIDKYFYKDKKNIYYLKEVTNDCTDVVENKLIRLGMVDVPSFKVLSEGYLATDSQHVFIRFFNIPNADPKSFSFVGDSNHTGGALEFTNFAWYKDINKVFTVSVDFDLCKGEYFISNVQSNDLDKADPLTFQYIGINPSTGSHFGYAKDKNFFYSQMGILSYSVTPITCKGDFFKICLPQIQSSLAQ